MSALISRFRSQKSHVESSNRLKGEGSAETSRPVPMSDLGFRVVTPYRVNAVIE